MGVLEIVSIFGGGVLIGYLFKLWSDRLTDKVNNLREIKDKNDQYEKVYQNVINKKSRFKTRVNNTVYIGTKLPDYGRVTIVYLLDKNDIVIFKEDKCIITSDLINKELVDKIIKEINYRHGYRIDDIVEVLGLIFYRPDFEKTFNVNIDEIKKLVEKDMVINPTDLDKESLNIPITHNKYLVILMDEKLKLKKFESNLKSLTKNKWLYYSGKMSEEQLIELKWEPFELALLRQDLDRFIESDDDVIESTNKVELQKEKVIYVENIIKIVSNKAWNIRAAIDWIKFTQGQ